MSDENMLEHEGEVNGRQVGEECSAYVRYNMEYRHG